MNSSDSGKGRLFIMTAIEGQKEDETFKLLKDTFEPEIETAESAESEEVLVRLKQSPKISKEMWKTAFAISVGILNDQDVNKEDNVGVVSGGKATRLSLFDLGHSTPTKFGLDVDTLLPKSTNKLADVLLFLINLFVSARNLPWTFTMIPEIKNQLSIE